MTLPERVTLVEVGPRDGLQNEPQSVPTAVKVALVERLAAAGLPAVEAGAFVSPKWVPQMADSAEVLAALERRPGVRYPVLVPNMTGYEAAKAAGAAEIAVFGAASESFTRKNINCSIAESLARFEPVAEAARADGLRLRGYVSCVLGCPYEGAIAPAAVARVAKALDALGCAEISLGDTIGGGTPARARAMLEAVAAEVPLERLLVETDSPYLAPVPKRGKRNEPAYVAHTAAALAELKDVPVEDIARTTTENAFNLFTKATRPASAAPST